MARNYPREQITWDINELRRLAALDPPQAAFFEKANRWVVKQGGKSFAVKPEQIVAVDDEQAAEQCHRERFRGGQNYDEDPDPDGFDEAKAAAEADDLIAHFTKKKGDE